MKNISMPAVAMMYAVVSTAGASAGSPAPAQPALLPQKVALSLSAVQKYFPAVTRLAQTGLDATAQGKPNATRGVFYENESGSKRVTITVDRYATFAQASSAYATALQKSEEVPGFKMLHVPKLGERTFAGSVTMRSETHVGLGLLTGNFVVGATLAGFPSSSDVVSQLVSMTRAELAVLGR